MSYDLIKEGGNLMEFRFNQIIHNSLSEKMKLEEIIIPQDLESKDSYDNERSIKVNVCFAKDKHTTALQR